MHSATNEMRNLTREKGKFSKTTGIMVQFKGLNAQADGIISLHKSGKTPMLQQVCLRMENQQKDIDKSSNQITSSVVLSESHQLELVFIAHVNMWLKTKALLTFYT